jgi:DNA-binding transcriptional MerR regulator
LHYYDSLGLLIPSERLQNGFRLYGKKDLQILLQILSLKFLKFDLVTIKGLLNGSILVQEEFLAQKKRLAKKLDKLAKAKKILENVASVTGLAPLDLVLKLIEMYRAAYHLD